MLHPRRNLDVGRASRPLGEVQAEELRAAAAVLGVDEVTLLSYPDGDLGEIPLEELAKRVDEATGRTELLVVFDEGGITGPPDHRRVNEAAVLAATRQRSSPQPGTTCRCSPGY